MNHRIRVATRAAVTQIAAANHVPCPSSSRAASVAQDAYPSAMVMPGGPQ